MKGIRNLGKAIVCFTDIRWYLQFKGKFRKLLLNGLETNTYIFFLFTYCYHLMGYSFLINSKGFFIYIILLTGLYLPKPVVEHWLE